MGRIFTGTQIHEDSLVSLFMRYVKIILFTFISIAALLSEAQESQVSSQNKKALKLYRSAEAAFLTGSWEIAELSLKKAIKKDPEFVEAWLLLGDAYSETGKMQEAVDAYKQALKIDSSFFPYAYYIIGNLEFKQGNYESALDAYKSFIASKGIPENEISEAAEKIKRTETALRISKNPLLVDPVNLGDKINSASDEYVNFVDEDITQLYLTKKEANHANATDGNPFKENFYTAFLHDGAWDSLTRFNLTVNQQRNIGGMSFSIDRKQIYFTGCSWPENYGSCDLYQIVKTGNNWGRAHNLGTPVNTVSWDSQPFLSSDGKTLYFTSRRQGGIGGSDIWMSEKQADGNWGMPVNLGNNINTSGNEMAPYIHADTKTLYFSSDTHAGLGGYDLFMSKKDENGEWSKAKNLGSPVNTKENELNIFISMDASKAWISSDREGGKGGFDIYELETVASIQPEPVVYVKGRVVDQITRKPLQALVELTNIDKQEIVVSATSDPINGSFFIPLYPGVNYAFHINKKGYLFYSEHMNLTDTLSYRPINKTFELTPLQKGNSFVLHNIFFDFDKYTLKPSSYTELELLANMLKNNSEIHIRINGHTDNVGSDDYNRQLSENRARAVYNYLMQEGIDADRLTYKSYGATKPVSSNDTPEGRAANRRTEIEIL